MKMKKCLRALLSMTVVVTGFSLFLNADPKPPKPTIMQRITTAVTSAKTAITSRLPGGSSRVTAVRDEGHSSRQETSSLRDRASGALQDARGKIEQKASGARTAVDKKVESGLGRVSEGAKTASGKIGELQGKVAPDSRAGKALGKVKEGVDRVGKKAQDKKDELGNVRGFREFSTSSKTSDASKKESKPGLADKAKKFKEDIKLKVMGGSKEADGVVEYKPGIKGNVESKAKQLKKDAIKKGKEVRSTVEKKGREVRTAIGKKAKEASEFVSQKTKAVDQKLDRLIKSNEENPRIKKFLETVKKGLGTVSVNARLKKENIKKDRAQRSINRHTEKIEKIDAQIKKAREDGDRKRLSKLEKSRDGLVSKRDAAQKRLETSKEKVSVLGKVRDAQKPQKPAGVQASGEQTADALAQEGKKGMSTKKKVAIGAGVAAVGLAGLVASQKTPGEAGAEGEGSSPIEASVPAAE